MSAWQILTQGLLIITVKLLPFKNSGCEELPLIAVKSWGFFLGFFHRLKNIRNCQRKLLFFHSQVNVMELSGNFEWIQMWQPCIFIQLAVHLAAQLIIY